MDRPLRAALSLGIAGMAAALLLPLYASGQTPPAPTPAGGDAEPEVFGETIDVRAVNLEVVVEDGAGRRVSGLKPADFALTVDGKPVPVDYFTEVAEGRALRGSAVAEGAAPSALPAVGGVEPGREVGTSYLVFVDDSLGVIPRNRNRMLRGFAEQLARLRPEDRMAVVAFGGRRPVLLSGWSQSPADLRRAFDQAIERPVHGLGTAAETREAQALAILLRGKDPEIPAALLGRGLRPSLPVAEETLDGEAGSSACSALLRLEARLKSIASSLAATMRSLSRVPGRKVALVLASGWPTLEKDVVCGNVGPTLWDPLAEVANQLGFTLYMTMSQEPPPAVSVEDREPPDQFFSNPQAQFSPLQETLFHLARETGGRAWAGNPRQDVLGLVADDTRSYYWLGFTPTWKGDDESHDVKVQVLRPGLQVRSRRGFSDLSRRSEVDNMVENALLFGQFEGALPLPVELGEIAPGGSKDTMRVPIKVRVPLDQVTMVQRGERFEGEVELRLAVLDQVGRRNDLPAVPVKLSGAEPPGAGEHTVYAVELELRREPQDVVVAVFDPPTGRLLETRKAIVPPGTGDRR